MSLIAQQDISYDADQKQQKAFKKVLEDYPVPLNAQKLMPFRSFPSEEGLKPEEALWGARHMASDEEGAIYISDSRANRILKFDRQGRFQWSKGQKGQGPGEFMWPRGIAMDENLIIVNDTGNHRFQMFDRSGRFFSSFAVYKTYYEMASNGRGAIYAAPVRSSFADPLIEVFDLKGRMVSAFGKGKEFSNWQQLNWIKIAASSESIYIAYQYLPILQVYSAAGKLQKESNYGSGFMKVQERSNLSRESGKTTASRGFIAVVQDLKQYGGNALVLVAHPRIEILEFNTGGQLRQEWVAEKAFYELVESFCCDVTSQAPYFFFLQTNPENLVRAFQSEHGNKQ